MNQPQIRDFQGKHIHMIGIGGSSMSGLAELLVKEGYHVSGSDRSNGYALEKLRKLGVRYTLAMPRKTFTARIWWYTPRQYCQTILSA